MPAGHCYTGIERQRESDPLDLCLSGRGSPAAGGRPRTASASPARDRLEVRVREFRRIDRLPPYVFNVVNDLKAASRRAGEGGGDLGMGHPHPPPPPPAV